MTMNEFIENHPGAHAIVRKNGEVHLFESEYAAMYAIWEDEYVFHSNWYTGEYEILSWDEIDYTGKDIYF